jgi:hypothetical protein
MTTSNYLLLLAVVTAVHAAAFRSCSDTSSSIKLKITYFNGKKEDWTDDVKCFFGDKPDVSSMRM